ncbi:MAG: 50S ribosomal protein L17 [Rickettsiales bacterium]|nr:50S ribosomal protein L17 [Rickettsiales bacterium]
MKHGRKLKKLNRTPSHRKSLLANLAVSLFKHERIQTTLTKAKALRPFAEKLITKSKTKNLHRFRQVLSVVKDKSIAKKLEELGERFKTRPGGYTRIYKYGFRAGDASPMALIELVDYSINAEKQKKTKSITAQDSPKTPKNKSSATSDKTLESNSK